MEEYLDYDDEVEVELLESQIRASRPPPESIQAEPDGESQIDEDFPSASGAKKTPEKRFETVFSWQRYLQFKKKESDKIAPLSCFPNCPLRQYSSVLVKDVFVEVKVKDTNVYWFATIQRFYGYHVVLKYEGASNSKSDIFTHLKDAYPVGHCYRNQWTLCPPKCVTKLYPDWTRSDAAEFMLQKLVGHKTLPRTFRDDLMKGTTSRFPDGYELELIDKNCLRQTRLAVVHERSGPRLCLRYIGLPDEFWCHEDSQLIHPKGWSAFVSHNIVASPTYVQESKAQIMKDITSTGSAICKLFKKVFIDAPVKFATLATIMPGMKLEAVDPLNPAAICRATVQKVLVSGYLMISIDGTSNVDGSDWFCFHITSPLILPAGFCKRNKLTLSVEGEDLEFDWQHYITENNYQLVPPQLLDTVKESGENPFIAGMSLEATDIMDPKNICVANIGNVAEHLVRVRFDGWDETYDQWMDFRSCDLFPTGWCDLVGHPLTPPVNLVMTKKKRK